jgi:hypothetical protein
MRDTFSVDKEENRCIYRCVHIDKPIHHCMKKEGYLASDKK